MYLFKINVEFPNAKMHIANIMKKYLKSWMVSRIIETKNVRLGKNLNQMNIESHSRRDVTEATWASVSASQYSVSLQITHKSVSTKVKSCI